MNSPVILLFFSEFDCCPNSFPCRSPVFVPASHPGWRRLQHPHEGNDTRLSYHHGQGLRDQFRGGSGWARARNLPGRFCRCRSLCANLDVGPRPQLFRSWGAGPARDRWGLCWLSSGSTVLPGVTLGRGMRRRGRGSGDARCHPGQSWQVSRPSHRPTPAKSCPAPTLSPLV